MVKPKPILFSGPMVRALLDGRKTQTRRVLKADPEWDLDAMLGPEWFSPAVANKKTGELEPGPEVFGIFSDCGEWGMRLPYAPGDLLYVREAWRVSADLDELSPADLLPMVSVRYEADNALNPGGLPIINPGRLRPGMHALKRHSRLTLRVTEVRVQRLQEISEEDARAEGAAYHDGRGIGHSGWRHDPAHGYVYPLARDSFGHLWQSLNAKRGFGWDVNPWVAAVSFEVILENVDAVLAQAESGAAQLMNGEG